MQIAFFWPAVLVAALIGFVVPALWYAPKVFGEAWMRLSGFKQEQAKNPTKELLVAAAASFIMAFALAGFLRLLGSNTFQQGFLAGLQLWLGFIVPALTVDYLFARRNLTLLAINMGHSGVALSLMGGLLAAWKS